MTVQKNKLVPVILCGGSGSRLWPLSRSSYPKQFLRLTGTDSLLQQTIKRCAALDATAPLLISDVTTRFIIAEQLLEIGIDNASILLEPVRRNTGPAIVSAALFLCQQHEDACMLILPSDHVIENEEVFAEAVAMAYEAAQSGYLMTFGIKPDRPETGYGYLRADSSEYGSVLPLAAFVEKPDLNTAKRYVESGKYFWNSGMFLFRATQLIDEIKKYAPNMLESCQRALSAASSDADFVRLEENSYAENPAIAIDYALMEQTKHAAMVALDAGWSDIGSWQSVWQVAQKNEDGNTMQGDVLLQDCKDCLIQADGRLIAGVGLENLAVIDTPDALLILNRKNSQDARKLVQSLLKESRREVDHHRQVSRPWGSFDSIGRGGRFQVKRLTVKPGAKLSLQMHHHRAEHWIVVSGTARVTHGGEDYLLTENQAAYIGVGIVHALENPGKIPLELIEVQSGSYLGEDDIVRLQDRYGRA